MIALLVIWESRRCSVKHSKGSTGPVDKIMLKSGDNAVRTCNNGYSKATAINT